MNNIKKLQQKLLEIDLLDKDDILYNSIQLRFDYHLKQYYNDLENSLKKLYNKIITNNIIKDMKELNLELFKKKKRKL